MSQQEVDQQSEKRPSDTAVSQRADTTSPAPASESDHARWVRDAVDAYEERLVNYVARLLGDGHRAADIVQEAFLRLCKKSAMELDGRLPQWLFTVCRNHAMDVRRKEKRTMPLAESTAETQASADRPPLQLVAEAEQSSEVLRLLANLPENQQEVVYLRFSGQLSYRQISEVTSLSVSNVGFLLHSAIKTLRVKMQMTRRLGG